MGYLIEHSTWPNHFSTPDNATDAVWVFSEDFSTEQIKLVLS